MCEVKKCENLWLKSFLCMIWKEKVARHADFGCLLGAQGVYSCVALVACRWRRCEIWWRHYQELFVSFLANFKFCESAHLINGAKQACSKSSQTEPFIPFLTNLYKFLTLWLQWKLTKWALYSSSYQFILYIYFLTLNIHLTLWCTKSSQTEPIPQYNYFVFIYSIHHKILLRQASVFNPS